MLKLIVAILGLAVFFVVYLIAIYNRLVGLRNRYRNAFSLIDVQLKRRHDLIPNLVETVKGYLQHERGTLEAVAVARSNAMAAGQSAALNPGEAQVMSKLSSAETTLTGALGRLLAISESYPQLKANQAMAQLMEDLTTTENRIAFARQAYNDAVMFYNTVCQTVPANLIASLFHFSHAEFLMIENAADKTTPGVSFS
jgi:LemA protein